MKIPYIIIGAAAIFGVSAVLWRRKRDTETEVLDGEVVDRTDHHAPKTVKSSLIVSFSCEISTLADCEKDSLSGRVYRFEAVLRDGAVKGRYQSRDRIGDSEDVHLARSVRFMRQLLDVISRYDLAQYNGLSHKVSGLPDEYGSTLDVVFASGERIYASDNQDPFIPREALGELVALFRDTKG